MIIVHPAAHANRNRKIIVIIFIINCCACPITQLLINTLRLAVPYDLLRLPLLLMPIVIEKSSSLSSSSIAAPAQ
jgi:hypothetical protein